MSARSNSEASSNASSPPSSVHMPGNNQVINNNNNAPKYGTLVPNRVFVGGIPSNTTEPELCQLFSKYGNVKATKIIADRAGVSKGYGFVTFETEEEAKRLQSDADNITLRERRLNIAPAVKKQPFSRVFETAASPPPTTPSLYYHNGMPYTFHNGMAYFPQTANQGPTAVPTPDLPTVFQGSGFAPQSNGQSYGPTMMYPCGANPAAAMFISPQPYNPYPHMPVPTQGPPPLMYTGGPNPSAANQAANAPSENTQSVQMTPGPPAPYYLPPTMTQTPEIFYNMQPAPSQGCYTPIVTLASHDNVVHYCDVPMEQNSNNITPEDTYTIRTPERPLSRDVPLPVSTIAAEKSNIHPSDKVFENSETPVVSLLSLQEDETSNRNRPAKIICGGRPPKFVSPGINRQPQSGYTYNGFSYPSTRGSGLYKDRGALNLTSRGRGRGVKHGDYNPPAAHDNNNNQKYIDKAESVSYKNEGFIRGGKTQQRGRGRGSSNVLRGGRRGSYPSPSQVIIPSPSLSPSLPFSTNNNPRPPRSSHMIPQPYPNYIKSAPLQMPQQLFHQRNFPNHFYPHYPPSIHQQAPPAPPPLPPPPQPPQNRRYGNGGKKPTNGTSNAHVNATRKLKTEGMDCGAAGDGPVPSIMQVNLTPPSSPGTNNKNSNSSSATQDLCAHVQAMSL